jgi:aminoglycoside/choline kinase family phosphotransferase
MSDRDFAIAAFLNQSRWQDWTRTPLVGDASARRYLRLSNDQLTAILMDAPAQNGESTGSFAQIATFLTEHGFAAPAILRHDPENGLLLLIDLGITDYVQWLNEHPDAESELYHAAADVLLKLETVEPPKHLRHMTPDVGAEMVEIIGTYYCKSQTTDLSREVRTALAEFAPEANVLALRDYHAENLIWRPEETGNDRVGLLDFQDAFIAPCGYDLASLLRDARRDVSPKVVQETIGYFSERTRAKSNFPTTVACLGIQRNLRILGVFARLATEMGKQRYLQFMPRVWGHIIEDLNAPALSNLRDAVLDTVPAPTPEYLAGLIE